MGSPISFSFVYETDAVGFLSLGSMNSSQLKSSETLDNKVKSMRDNSYCILIPVYNGAQVLGATLDRLTEFETPEHILVVDDGSVDGSGEIARQRGIEVLVQTPNQGKGQALRRGMQHLNENQVQWCITMDADGQHAPEDLAHFLNHQVEGDGDSELGVIVGSRNFRDKSMPWERVFSNSVSTKLVEMVCGCRVWDAQCGYRAYNTSLLNKNCLPENGRFEWESEVLVRAAHAGFLVSTVPVQTIYEEGNVSHISHVKDTWRFLKMLGQYI